MIVYTVFLILSLFNNTPSLQVNKYTFSSETLNVCKQTLTFSLVTLNDCKLKHTFSSETLNESKLKLTFSLEKLSECLQKVRVQKGRKRQKKPHIPENVRLLKKILLNETVSKFMKPRYQLGHPNQNIHPCSVCGDGSKPIRLFSILRQ